MLFAAEGGQIAPEFYTMLFTMHATVMIFFVIIPILAGAFGNFLIPLMIGADDMAFPTLNMLSYWFMWPAFICIRLQLLRADGRTAAGGRLDVVSAAVVVHRLHRRRAAQTLWLIGLTFVGVSSMMGSVNYMTTIIQMRAPGMTMFRLPMTIWAMFITAILQAFALAGAHGGRLHAACWTGLLGTGFFMPEGLDGQQRAAWPPAAGSRCCGSTCSGSTRHPAVYIMILPAMGMVSDIIACFARKPLFGYKPMVYSIAGIAGLGFIVWGHHMFVSGMNPVLGMTFMVATMMIALPSAIKVFNWLGTIWGGKIQFTTPMLFALAFVSMFIIGGLSGIFMAATPVDIFIHDTYFIVAHFHYVLFAGTAMGVFGAIYFWFPKMFGRMMNETWGKVHFFLTFIFLNGTFYPDAHPGRGRLSAAAGRSVPLRDVPPPAAAEPVHDDGARSCMVASQIIFVVNFFYSMFFGPTGGPQSVARQQRWNGRRRARRATATSISSRSSTAARTNTARRKSTPTTTRRRSRRRQVTSRTPRPAHH